MTLTILWLRTFLELDIFTMFAILALNNREVVMSRIDVVHADKNKFKIMINFVQRGIEFNSDALANQEAKKLHSQIPHAELHLING